MGDVNGPLIVRYTPGASYVKPGMHSHNSGRRFDGLSSRLVVLKYVRILLLIVGLIGLGYYGYTLSDEYIYQAYQNWAFDQQIAGRKVVTFGDYVRERTPFGFLVGSKPAVSVATKTPPSVPSAPAPSEALPLVQGSLLGRVEIGRLNLSAMVREGVDDKTLSVAVGHIPSTALPGQSGNFAIAAHRDTLFRALKDIRKDDLVTFQSPAGTYTYQVFATKIVKPSDVSVLRSDGGSLVTITEPAKLLTMITCYPFYYVGSAPNRFIVEAKLVSDDPEKKLPSNEAQSTGPPKTTKQASAAELRSPRSSSRFSRSHSKRARDKNVDAKPAPKKRGFWHKLLHVS
jgi:sortase A